MNGPALAKHPGPGFNSILQRRVQSVPFLASPGPWKLNPNRVRQLSKTRKPWVARSPPRTIQAKSQAMIPHTPELGFNKGPLKRFQECENRKRREVYNSVGVVTALLPHIGYKKCTEAAAMAVKATKGGMVGFYVGLCRVL